MQFKVPQDVQRADTIIGPITMTQLIILGAGGGTCYAIYVSLAKTYFMEIWLPPVAVIGALTLAFAFLKIHELPFHVFLMDLLEFYLLPRKRVWIQGTAKPLMIPTEKKKVEIKKTEDTSVKEKKSIQELTSILDSHGAIKPKQ